MANTEIKICGLSTPETVDAAVDAGATHIGLVHYEPSPRHVSLDQAARLRARVPSHVKVVLLLVSMDALAPFRVPFARPADDPQPLPYLDGEANRAQGGVDVRLEVRIDTPRHAEQHAAPSRIAGTSFRHQYWTPAQMVTQHTVGGCNLQPGDLLGTGTISGPAPGEAGAIVELSQGGRAPITLVATGEQRTFLQDGDTVILRGWCEAPGRARIGFGECRGTVLPAVG